MIRKWDSTQYDADIDLDILIYQSAAFPTSPRDKAHEEWDNFSV